MPSLIEEHLVAIRERLQATSAGPEEDQARWLNMSSEHKRTLFTLRGDKSRTIKPAEKGSCIMIQDTEDYLQPGLAFLSDPETYRELESDTSTEMAHKANDLLERLHRQGMLTRYTAAAHSAKLKELRQQRMYFLKKVYKTPLKLRPILSCCSGPTQGISKLANTILSNYLDTVPSLVSSSTQVLKHTGTTETTQHRRTTHVSNHGREQSVPIHSSSAWHQLRSTTCYAHLPSHLQRQSKKEHGERHAQLDLEGKHHRICRKALPTTQGSGNGNTSEVHRRHPGHLGKQSSRNEQPGIPL